MELFFPVPSCFPSPPPFSPKISILFREPFPGDEASPCSPSSFLCQPFVAPHLFVNLFFFFLARRARLQGCLPPRQKSGSPSTCLPLSFCSVFPTFFLSIRDPLLFFCLVKDSPNPRSPPEVPEVIIRLFYRRLVITLFQFPPHNLPPFWGPIFLFSGCGIPYFIFFWVQPSALLVSFSFTYKTLLLTLLCLSIFLWNPCPAFPTEGIDGLLPFTPLDSQANPQPTPPPPPLYNKVLSFLLFRFPPPHVSCCPHVRRVSLKMTS